MPARPSQSITYIGPAGAGLGFRLSGMDVHECTSEDEVVPTLKKLKKEGLFSIIFIDEALAENNLQDIEKLNSDSLPVIILLPNPAEPKNIAARNLQQLMVRAVGSDIFS